MTSLEKGLRDFAQFAAKLKGDEKSEAQTFLFHLLAAFGHDPNTLPEGSTFEHRVHFSSPPIPKKPLAALSLPMSLDSPETRRRVVVLSATGGEAD